MSSKDAGPPGGYNTTDNNSPQFDPSNPKGGPLQQAAVATAAGNRPTQNTPFGSMQWSMDPNTGQWTQNQTAAPGLQQSLFNLQGQGANGTASPISNGSQARSQAFNSLYSQGASRLDPQWSMNDDNMKTQLANQGLTPGTPAYDQAYANEQRSKNDAYSSLTNNASLASGNAAQQQQQMDVTAQQAPFNTMNMIKSLMQMPSFSAGPDYLGAANATNQYNLQNQQLSNSGWGNMMGGLFNLGSQGMQMLGGQGGGGLAGLFSGGGAAGGAAAAGGESAISYAPWLAAAIA